MKGVTQKLLNKVLDSADVHHETSGTRIEYDTESFHLTSVLDSNEYLTYDAYDSDDNEVKLSDDQQIIVFNFVKDLQDEEAERVATHKRHFSIGDNGI